MSSSVKNCESVYITGIGDDPWEKSMFQDIHVEIQEFVPEF